MSTILHVMQHALGRDEYGRRKPAGVTEDYRNHFCTSDGPDFLTCRDAAAQGLMLEHAPREISGGDTIFTVTEAGKAFITASSPRPPKVTRSQARYLAYLAYADFGSLTFGEWLKGGWPSLLRTGLAGAI